MGRMLAVVRRREGTGRMPPPTEIASVQDATTRLNEMFRPGGGDGIDPQDTPRYAALLDLLSDHGRFAAALENASAAIWAAYNRDEIRNQPNRYTRAILHVGATLGFASGDLRVLTAAASPQAFGDLLRNRLLWKDSFALGHGEFAHSYQWLAAGLALNWGTNTARLYAETRGRLSMMPCWVKDDAGGLPPTQTHTSTGPKAVSTSGLANIRRLMSTRQRTPHRSSPPCAPDAFS